MRHGIVIYLCLLSTLALCNPLITKIHAGTLKAAITGGPRICKQIISIKEARFKNVVSQSLDFSCGAAALATLLKYQFGRQVTETDVIKGMFSCGDQMLIKKRGFSLLDMKRYAQDAGCQANGYKLKIEQLRQVNIPTIVLINVRGYTHFVVLKGIIGKRVFVADSAWGNRIMDIEEFSKAWNNVIFVVKGPKEGAPAGLAVAQSTGIAAQKWQIIKIKERVLDSFVMDTSTSVTSGNYPWW